MSIEIKVPPLPESVTDATLVAWHKKPGESVARDENLVDLETDKVVLEVPAPASGTLAKILVQDGATVTAGDVLAVLEEGEVAATEAPSAAKSPPSAEEAVEVAEPDRGVAPRLSPAVRRLLGGFEGRAVVTSDHGTALGERVGPVPVREWGHPWGVYAEPLVTVPWLVREGSQRRDVVASQPHEESVYDEDLARERLRALGYA